MVYLEKRAPVVWVSPHFLPLFRFTEKGNLEVLLFTIQSKMRANNQKVYMPREGKLISDINKVRNHSSELETKHGTINTANLNR